MVLPEIDMPIFDIIGIYCNTESIFNKQLLNDYSAVIPGTQSI